MNASHALSPADAGSGASRSPGIGEQARGLADGAKQSAEAFADERKTEGAERLQGVADTVGKVADQVAEESPAMAEWVRKAANGLDDVSRNLKDKSVADLLDMAKGFARREPAAFIAASAVAGFALSRLLKSTATSPATSSPSYGTAEYTSPKGFETTPVSNPTSASPTSGAGAGFKPSGPGAAGHQTPDVLKPASDVDPALAPDTGAPSPLAGGSLAALKTKAGDPSI